MFGYVYVLTRASFHYQSENLLEIGRNLGFQKNKLYFQLSYHLLDQLLSLAYLWLLWKLYQILVQFFLWNINTYNRIYNSWISLDDLAFANQLSFFLLVFILGLFFIENLARKEPNITHLQEEDLRKRKNYI